MPHARRNFLNTPVPIENYVTVPATADAIQRLRECCVREYTRASMDPSPDRKIGRKAILEAETRINAVPETLTYSDFLDAAWHSLEELHQRYSRDDVLDPDGWASGAVGAIQNEILELRRGG